MSVWNTDVPAHPSTLNKPLMHAPKAHDDPMYVFYKDIIREVDGYINSWHKRDGLTVAQRNQAIASALMAQTTFYFMGQWGRSREEFLQMAAEEWDMRVPDEVERRLKNATLLVAQT